MAYTDAVKQKALIKAMGAKKFVQLMKDAMQRGDAPPDDGVTYEWLKQAALKSFGKLMTIYVRMKNLL